jgi:hypothetical protein
MPSQIALIVTAVFFVRVSITPYLAYRTNLVVTAMTWRYPPKRRFDHAIIVLKMVEIGASTNQNQRCRPSSFRMPIS